MVAADICNYPRGVPHEIAGVAEVPVPRLPLDYEEFHVYIR